MTLVLGSVEVLLLGSLSNNDAATAAKTSLKWRIRAASTFIVLIPFRLIRQSLANIFLVKF